MLETPGTSRMGGFLLGALFKPVPMGALIQNKPRHIDPQSAKRDPSEREIMNRGLSKLGALFAASPFWHPLAAPGFKKGPPSQARNYAESVLPSGRAK